MAHIHPERMIDVDGGRLAVQQIGDDGAPAIVLVAGASSSMDWWDDALCVRLADGDHPSGGRRVIRYDLRDTGRSTTQPRGAATYTGSDLVDDLACIIEAFDAAPAHVVGLSLGGGLAQQLALRRPDLVATLTLMATSPTAAGGPGDPLPPPTPELSESFAHPLPSPDWSDASEVGDYFVQTERLFSGTIPVDERRIRGIAARVVERSIDPAAGENHWQIDEGEGMRTDLASISQPTLVLHGTDDPLFPLPHGERIAALIPGARVIAVPGMGHQNPPPSTWDLIVPAILELTAGKLAT